MLARVCAAGLFACSILAYAQAPILPPAPLPNFFSGETSTTPAGQPNNGWYWLAFPNQSLFGYYYWGFYSSGSIIYHEDLGFESYLSDSSDPTGNSAYLYDFTSQGWFWTTTSYFPWVYSTSLGTWLQYVIATPNQDYTSAPRVFNDQNMGQNIQLGPAADALTGGGESLTLLLHGAAGSGTNSASNVVNGMVQLLSGSTVLCTMTWNRPAAPAAPTVVFDTNAAGCSFLSNPITVISAPVSTVNTPQGQYPDPTAVEIQINLNYASGTYTVQSCYPLTNCGSFTSMGTIALTGAVTVAAAAAATSVTINTTTYALAASIPLSQGPYTLRSGSSGTQANTVMAYSYFDGNNKLQTAAPTSPNASASGSCPWNCSGGSCSTPLTPAPVASPAPVISGVSGFLQSGGTSTITINGNYFGSVAGAVSFCTWGVSPCQGIPTDGLPMS